MSNEYMLVAMSSDLGDAGSDLCGAYLLTCDADLRANIDRAWNVLSACEAFVQIALPANGVAVGYWDSEYQACPERVADLIDRVEKDRVLVGLSEDDVQALQAVALTALAGMVINIHRYDAPQLSGYDRHGGEPFSSLQINQLKATGQRLLDITPVAA